MKLKLMSLVFFLAISSTVKAQDPIFTQYFMVPETLNPGFTGFLETTTTGILHRTQWPDLNFRVDSDFGFFNKAAVAIGKGWDNFLSFTIVVINLWPFVVLLGIAWLLVRGWAKKRASNREV